MYEEPYKWVEAVGNRRQYLDEQFKEGSPVVAMAYDSGILLLTVSKGTPKLYEIYDRLALGGMGHPADLEKLRFSLLETAHVEGFNRSPSDVTGSRMVKYGIAPILKQAFEEVFKAPFIVKLLLAELGTKVGAGSLMTINYDGTFEETSRCAVLAATPAVQQSMIEFLQREVPDGASLDRAVVGSLLAWAMGDQAQRRREADSHDTKEHQVTVSEDPVELAGYLRERMPGKTLECVLLDRHERGSSKYRTLTSDELSRMLPPDLKAALA
ncbi:MAG: 20S proteasome subunit A/B [Nitrospira sp.]|nr:20S proteasome subunit A/B [Nitrospira sp.]